MSRGSRSREPTPLCTQQFMVVIRAPWDFSALGLWMHLRGASEDLLRLVLGVLHLGPLRSKFGQTVSRPPWDRASASHRPTRAADACGEGVPSLGPSGLAGKALPSGCGRGRGVPSPPNSWLLEGPDFRGGSGLTSCPPCGPALFRPLPQTLLRPRLQDKYCAHLRGLRPSLTLGPKLLPPTYYWVSHVSNNGDSPPRVGRHSRARKARSTHATLRLQDGARPRPEGRWGGGPGTRPQPKPHRVCVSLSPCFVCPLVPISGMSTSCRKCCRYLCNIF